MADVTGFRTDASAYDAWGEDLFLDALTKHWDDPE
jgi:hypothetical protein